MFGGSSKSNSFLGGGESSSSGESIIPGFQDEPACAQICPNLSYKQRILGYLGCTGFGYLLSLLGTLTLFSGFTTANIELFAIFYVVGNIIALFATGFLLGPKQQCKKMWDPTRRWSTAFYLSMLIIVFACAVSKQNIFLVLFLLFVQILAGAWYTLSYVPFGRKIVLTFFRSLGICYPCFAVSDAAQEFYKNNIKKQSSLTGSSSSSSSKPSGFFSSK